MINRLFAAKLRRPTGFFGRLVGNVMARGNEHEAGWTVSLLNIQPDQHILEIGFGPGVAIQYASQKAVHGLVAGIDYAETMVQVASKRNAPAIKARHVDLKHGEVTALPYPDEAFDTAFTIHCIYFWAKPIDGLTEIRRILRPGGLVAVTIKPKDKWPQERTPPADLFTLYDSDEVAQLLSKAGYRDVRVELYPRPDEFPGACVLGVKWRRRTPPANDSRSPVAEPVRWNCSARDPMRGLLFLKPDMGVPPTTSALKRINYKCNLGLSKHLRVMAADHCFQRDNPARVNGGSSW
jgi:ubiquinone/menaquinone biosynthesis C-methylase UbiE